MAFVLSDRIKETTTTTSTGTYTLGGAVSGFETFTANLSNGDTTYYCCTDGTDFEVGLGTFASSGTTLARTTIISSSNSNNAVNWSSGSRDIFCTLPGSKAVFKDGSDNINGTFVGNITGNVTGNTSGTAATVTGAAQSNITSVGTLTGLTTSGVINLSQTSGPAIKTTGNLGSTDFTVLRASGTTDGEFGWDMRYMGSRFGNSNAFAIEMHNQSGTNVEAVTILQDGKVGMGTIAPASTLDVVGDITITSTDAGSSENPSLRLFRNSATPADFDNLGNIDFIAENSASEAITVASISGMIDDVTDGTEDGRIRFTHHVNGTHTEFVDFVSDQMLFLNEGRIGWYQQNGSYNIHLAGGTPSANRTVTLPDATGTVALTSDITVTASSTTTFTNKTLTSPKINEDVAVTATATEINKLDGVTATTTELNYVDVTTLGTVEASKAVTADANGNVLFPDNEKLEFGSSNDVELKHTGSNFQILNATGGLQFTNFANDQDVDIRSDDGSGGTALYFKADGSTGEALLYHYGTEKIKTTSDGATVSGDLLIESTDAGSSDNPTLELYRNSSSPAVNDLMGHIIFSGEDAAGNKANYAEIESVITDTTDGSEDGILRLRATINGSMTTYYNAGYGANFFFKNVALHTGVNLSFEGATNNNFETLVTVVDPTQDNTITLPDATGTVLTTGNSDTPTTTTSSSDADFVLVDDGGTMKKITPSNLGITSGGASKGFAVAMAIAL